MSIKEQWKKLTNNEKAMIGALVILVIMIALSWGRVKNGVQKSLKPYMENVK